MYVCMRISSTPTGESDRFDDMCMYVSMYECMHVCMCVPEYTLESDQFDGIHTHTHTEPKCVQQRLYINTYIHTYIHTEPTCVQQMVRGSCIHGYMHLYVHIYVHTYVY